MGSICVPPFRWRLLRTICRFGNWLEPTYSRTNRGKIACPERSRMGGAPVSLFPALQMVLKKVCLRQGTTSKPVLERSEGCHKCCGTTRLQPLRVGLSLPLCFTDCSPKGNMNGHSARGGINCHPMFHEIFTPSRPPPWWIGVLSWQCIRAPSSFLCCSAWFSSPAGRHVRNPWAICRLFRRNALARRHRPGAAQAAQTWAITSIRQPHIWRLTIRLLAVPSKFRLARGTSPPRSAQRPPAPPFP